MQYRVFGYTDEDPASESLLFSANEKELAVSWAKENDMATAVVDFETDEVLYSSADLVAEEYDGS